MILRDVPVPPSAPRARVQHFATWTEDLQRALETVEQQSFSPELRYTCDDMAARAKKPGFEGLLLTDPNGPLAIMLVNRIELPVAQSGGSPAMDALYLDTLAVRDRGRGIGTYLLTCLIQRCTAAGLPAIQLDTDDGGDGGDGGDGLPEYYRRFGFQVLGVDPVSGNVTMIRYRDTW